ncbi:hypothetical protein IJQ51_01920 [Candidatus Saccharibacteria bacterium]|nr:hypothetical protein [Candidatus Saccharibacteria bacterium]MBR0242683.1 hypothetical protein [Candidatus Saccharibacteria bacterium]
MEMQELAKAFEEEKPKKKVLPIVAFAIGLVALLAGVILLALKLNANSIASDAERLVEIGAFMKEDEAGVIWQFTEIGKGKLTTNNHVNDYDFIWAIEGGKLKIETDWLYELEDEFDYEIDGEKLVLDGEIVFLPAQVD